MVLFTAKERDAVIDFFLGKAVKNNRLYGDIDPDLFLRPGPRLVEGLEEIHKRLFLK